MDLALAGKAALVTGATGGIGRATALRLAREGMDVAVTGRSADRLAALHDEIIAGGGRAVAIAADLREPEAAGRVVATAVAALGRLDLLVNCAGATKRGDVLALDEADWTDGFALKFFGTVRMVRAAWPHLREAAGGIVTVAGNGGRTGDRDFAIGGSVNAALGLLTKALTDRGIGDGVRVNAINPGIVETDRYRVRLARLMAETGLSEQDAAARMRATHRVARFARPEEVADLIAVMASPRLAHLNGAIVDLDGGETRAL
jgi:3-oxoacyl-[acyl-carrier protein] reductase